MSIFSTDSKLYKGISWFGNIVVLNFCWLLFSLPIVTIGASTVAAFSIALKMIDGNEGYMFKGFLKAFKDNWKRGTLLWIVTLVAGYAIYLDIQLLRNTEDPSYLLIIVSVVSILFVFFALLYAYPLCARYDNKWYLHIKNSLILSIRYFKKTLFLIVILALEVGLCLWNEKTLILIVIIGPMIMMYTVAGSARKIFADIEKINADEAAMAKAKGETTSDKSETK
jgi:uncharacterized membrane protein YesL